MSCHLLLILDLASKWRYLHRQFALVPCPPPAPPWRDEGGRAPCLFGRRGSVCSSRGRKPGKLFYKFNLKVVPAVSLGLQKGDKVSNAISKEYEWSGHTNIWYLFTHLVPCVSHSTGTLWFVMQNFSVVCTVKEKSFVRWFSCLSII